jgi:hypothetical protein
VREVIEALPAPWSDRIETGTGALFCEESFSLEEIIDQIGEFFRS